MAGYMTKLQGYVFTGEYANGNTTPVENGVMQKLDPTTQTLKNPGEDTTTRFLCVEKTGIYGGVPAYRFVVAILGGNIYFVENGFSDVNVETDYDIRTYSKAPGELMRAHPLIVGEEFVTTMVQGDPKVGTLYGMRGNGTIG